MNPHLIKLCLGGGLFAVMAFIHFFVDFVCQTHFEAMNKYNNALIRARHCLIYSLGFLPLIVCLRMWGCYSGLEALIAMNVLFWSHFYCDMYHQVYLWALHIRKPPEMLPPNDPKEGFIKFISTILGKILMISVDQISHLVFLFVLVYMALN